MEERKSVFSTNQDLRDENREIRSNFKAAKKEKIEKFRKAFTQRVGSRLETLSDEKLEKVIVKIDTMLERFETQADISEERREDMLSALLALKEMIEEELESDDLEEDVLETVEALLVE